MPLTEPTVNNGKLMMGLVRDHLELASLELHYEKDKAQRRLLGWMGAALFALTAFVFFQIMLVGLLEKAGLGLGWIGLIGTSLYAGLGWFIFKSVNKTDQGTGRPFQGTKLELQRTFNWIEKNLF